MLIVHNADRHSSPAKAANNTQTLVVAADHHRPDGMARGTHNAGLWNGLGQSAQKDQLPPSFRLMQRINSFEANSAPETKPSSGPKLRAAGLPRKCNPGIEDSSPRLSTG